MTRCGAAMATILRRTNAAEGTNSRRLRAIVDSFKRFARLPPDDVEEGLGLAAADRVLVDDVKRIVGMLHVQPGNGARGPADQIQIFSPRGAQHRGGRQRPLCRFGNCLDAIAELRQTQRSERERDSLAYLPYFPSTGGDTCSYPDQFDAASAKVAHEPIGIRNSGEHAGSG